MCVTEAANFEDDEEYLDLLRQHTALLLEEEELLATGMAAILSQYDNREKIKQDYTCVSIINTNY